MGKTNIGWCSHSLNFIKWWCTKHSEGCKNCYMMTLAKMYPQHSAEKAVWREKAYDELKKLPAGAEVFVGDMYDLFHEQMPLDFIQRHFQLISSRPDCTFLLLTKRIERAAELSHLFRWTDNIYMGTSVENQKRLFRIEVLKGIPAKRKYLSIEPLLENLGYVDFRGIDSVITGGESGANRRPFQHEWALEIQRQCERDGVAFYHKQGGHQYPGQDRELNGRTYDDLHWRHTETETVEQGVLL